MKRQDIDWEKIFANHMPEKELVSRIYKELSKLNSKKINIPIKTWTKALQTSKSQENSAPPNQLYNKC